MTSSGNKQCRQHPSDISKLQPETSLHSAPPSPGRAPLLSRKTHSSELSELVRPSSGTARVCGGTESNAAPHPALPRLFQTEGGSNTFHRNVGPTRGLLTLRLGRTSKARPVTRISHPTCESSGWSSRSICLSALLADKGARRVGALCRVIV